MTKSVKGSMTSQCNPGRVQRLVGMGLVIHLQGQNLVLQFPPGMRAGSSGEGPSDLVGRV